MAKALSRFALNTLRPNSLIYTPKGYDQHPRPFHLGVSEQTTNRCYEKKLIKRTPHKSPLPER